jgi:hypothetical protein
MQGVREVPKKVNTIYAVTSGSRKNWEVYRENLETGEVFTISTSPIPEPHITIMTMLGAQKRGEVELVSKDKEEMTATWRYLG